MVTRMVTSSYVPQAMVTLVFLNGNINGNMNGNITIRPPDDGNIGVSRMVTRMVTSMVTSPYDPQTMVTLVFLDGNMNGNMNGNMI